MPDLRTGILFTLLTYSAYTDCRIGKIRNNAILAGIAACVALTIQEGAEKTANMFLGGMAALVLGYLFWKLRVFRGGDAKLIWMLGNYTGFKEFGIHFIVIILVGGVAALGLMLKKGVLMERIKRMWDWFCMLLMMRSFKPYAPLDQDPCFLPFGLTTLIAECFLLVWNYCGNC